MGGSFKNGAGSLDFEENDTDDTDESPPESVSEQAPPTQTSPETSETTDEPQQDGTRSSTSTPAKYPYFVRRNSVGDERSNRLEVHVRDDVADQESAFLTALADELDTDGVAKTDAREFALKLAHEHPDEVAQLMREEGYGELS
ncbi:acyl-CoA dehydrogenase [Halorussus caseinilyticus]|uniref:acyl-CoA dehydrogenase n=1 Tax=Halorussus caseinilyticus TaxID=3034025 RepID=UPI0023E76EE4|nr:acyl-CoA dehydrogenase [Halorussus sp. DT72]